MVSQMSLYLLGKRVCFTSQYQPNFHVGVDELDFVSTFFPYRLVMAIPAVYLYEKLIGFSCRSESMS